MLLGKRQEHIPASWPLPPIQLLTRACAKRRWRPCAPSCGHIRRRPRSSGGERYYGRMAKTNGKSNDGPLGFEAALFEALEGGREDEAEP